MLKQRGFCRTIPLVKVYHCVCRSIPMCLQKYTIQYIAADSHQARWESAAKYCMVYVWYTSADTLVQWYSSTDSGIVLQDPLYCFFLFFLLDLQKNQKLFSNGGRKFPLSYEKISTRNIKNKILICFHILKYFMPHCLLQETIKIFRF